MLERPPAVAYFVAYQVLRNHEDAREAVADAVALAWQHGGGYRGEAMLQTWFVGIVKNCALMEMRRRRQMQRWIDEPHPQRDERTPLWLVFTAERQRRMAQAVRHLPPLYRAAVECVYYDDLPLEAAARQLGISYGACRSRMHVARRILAERIRT